MVGKIYNYNGRLYEVLANKGTEYVMAECVADGEFKGDTVFLCDVVEKGDEILAPNSFNYTVTKTQLYDEIKNAGAENKSVKEMVGAIRNRYYKIPSVFCTLVAESFTRA